MQKDDWRKQDVEAGCLISWPTKNLPFRLNEEETDCLKGLNVNLRRIEGNVKIHRREMNAMEIELTEARDDTLIDQGNLLLIGYKRFYGQRIFLAN